jgi:hypothetical protein
MRNKASQNLPVGGVGFIICDCFENKQQNCDVCRNCQINFNVMSSTCSVCDGQEIYIRWLLFGEPGEENRSWKGLC